MDITAAVLREVDAELTVERLHLRDPGVGELLVEIVATGMCHTDLLPRQRGFFASLPLVLGHEGAGVVRAVGPHVTDFSVGDHVLLSYVACGDCANCRRGEPYSCYRFFGINMTGRALDRSPGPMSDGATAGLCSSWFGQSSFASHTVVAAAHTVRIDPELPLSVLAPLGCGFQTGAGAVMNVIRPQPGSSIAVVGVGAVGLAAVMAARAEGAGVIVAVDRQSGRLEMARKVGATATVDTSFEDLKQALRSAADGGVDAIIDTTGNPQLVQTAIDAVRPGGTVVMVGTSTRPITLAPGALALGKSLVGVIEGSAIPREFLPRLVELWRAGRFPIENLLTTYPLTEIARAEQDLRSGAVIKPVLLPAAGTIDTTEGQ
ncbi:aryl-alcohol dehydrogenase AdhB [Mycobacteroides abscessus subsp. abscessus]|nr:aryl-alcohol dehydrogenase AdhB [Mycobacteroides abscessus subsp. abscessus]